jgi:hypothetical protein
MQKLDVGVQKFIARRNDSRGVADKRSQHIASPLCGSGLCVLYKGSALMRFLCSLLSPLTFYVLMTCGSPSLSGEKCTSRGTRGKGHLRHKNSHSNIPW